MNLLTYPSIDRPIVTTVLRVIVNSALFLVVECLLDCSGLDKIADFYDFLEQQQKTSIQANTEKQMAKAIGKLFIQTQALQMG